MSQATSNAQRYDPYKNYRFRICRCWVSEYSALPDLDANVNAMAIEHMTVQHEGWAMEPPAGGSDQSRLGSR